ncbi:hypothetical protein EMIHUDRAFT_205733 [Emiliania huxleyi CCMP1516]|uniref:Uncharacterized protein n=2 Tax=Emiliania huxleyi TaxID=2903 RepID=A0A0D3IHF7_EMIH1|nr:hypothetical protein EMIHUDRAFT_215482 [Emiliania huxleyi CCMP1516]XP_005778094.1 hypothetical protein EMIHUDRAFT_205733 [Emiliania huxleyi CCMP1516]EOD10692.1 hypothetical protein EMIHUDRAFT_215482 [Emiliania huxleyi CCMP1516]EOD25665.1 hypothetical protein EMIHUDRAFT_205733 [Emiliania huxleyi CCMP1516]|eukprot:XP_005763121.1 hypothetical protein EMIHUDRAFT_215482 [Emiliania huxleyi CCMP1516]
MLQLCSSASLGLGLSPNACLLPHHPISGPALVEPDVFEEALTRSKTDDPRGALLRAPMRKPTAEAPSRPGPRKRRASAPVKMVADSPLCDAECAAELAAKAKAIAEASAPALESAVRAAPAVAGTAAQVAGTAATGLFKLGWKGVEVAAPVVVEGTKAAIPVVAEGAKAASRALEDPASLDLAGTLTSVELPTAGEVVEGTSGNTLLGHAPWVEAMPEPSRNAALGFLSSSFGVALIDAAPYAIGAAVLLAVAQAALASLKDAAAAALPPIAATVAAGLGAYAALQAGFVSLPDPAALAIPALAICGGSNYVGVHDVMCMWYPPWTFDVFDLLHALHPPKNAHGHS